MSFPLMNPKIILPIMITVTSMRTPSHLWIMGDDSIMLWDGFATGVTGALHEVKPKNRRRLLALINSGRRTDAAWCPYGCRRDNKNMEPNQSVHTGRGAVLGRMRSSINFPDQLHFFSRRQMRFFAEVQEIARARPEVRFGPAKLIRYISK